MPFVNFKKNKLLNAVKECQFPCKVIALTKPTLQETQISVKVRGLKSKSFKVKKA